MIHSKRAAAGLAAGVMAGAAVLGGAAVLAMDFMDMTPFVRTVAEAEQSGTPGGDHIRILATAKETGGQFSMIEDAFLTEESGVPAHRHHWHDEMFYVVNGSFEIINGEGAEPVIVEAGDAIFTPRGTLHEWRAHEVDSKFVMVYTPGGWENFFREWLSLTPEQRDDQAFLEEFGRTYDTTEFAPEDQR